MTETKSESIPESFDVEVGDHQYLIEPILANSPGICRLCDGVFPKGTVIAFLKGLGPLVDPRTRFERVHLNCANSLCPSTNEEAPHVNRAGFWVETLPNTPGAKHLVMSADNPDIHRFTDKRRAEGAAEILNKLQEQGQI